MTDQMIHADKVKKIADWLWDEMMANGGLDEKIAPQLAARAQMCWEVRAQLLALLRPTLADMTPEERRACQWMQADVANVEARAVIVNPNEEDGKARVVWQGAFNEPPIDWEKVTPRPDVPCMEWPGDTPNKGPKVTFSMPAPSALPNGWRLAKHQTRGTVIVTRPEPDNDGEVIVLCPDPNRVTRAALVWCKNDKLTYTDTEPEADQ